MTLRRSSLVLVLLCGGLLAGCSDKSTDETGKDSDDSGDTGDSGDTTDTEDSAVDTAEWTEGPALPDCTAQSGAGDLVALSGVVLGPDGPEAGVVVYSRSAGTITCVGADCDTSAADIVCTEGIVSPGLINAHDHMQYNVLAPWQHADLYESRYDWRADDAYDEYRTAYDAIYDDSVCEIMKWAELRNLVAGATAGVGSTDVDGCINVAIRNLDESGDASGIEDYNLYYSASIVTDSFDESDGADFTAQLAAGSYNAVENHVAEGVGGVDREEIEWMFEIGMEGPGQVYVHATDATTGQLARMAETGTAILWAPRSNLDLYGATTLGDVAIKLGVPVALGPDWTWSGSMNPAHEMQCAQEYLSSRGNFGGAAISDRQLFGMTTDGAASILGLEGVLGSLEAGARADISVFSYSATPYRAVIQSEPQDTHLVIVNGNALYGDTDLVAALNDHPEWCETVDVCDDSAQPRLVCLARADSGTDGQTMAEVEGMLSAGLAAVEMPEELAYAAELFGLWTCDTTRVSCDVSAPTSDDGDGDGVADSADGCSGGYDPGQEDWDEDGMGDVCDPCPLQPDATDCEPGANDVDGDGVSSDEDGCPYDYDPEQTDTDSDGTGDACDACPNDANPNNSACPSSVPALADESDPDHPAEYTNVALSDLVVTAVRDGYGFYAQDPTVSAYGGVFVYDRGENSISQGDTVNVEGTYQEYNGLVEISSPTVDVTGEGTIPDPLVIADPCTVATGGADAEPYEAMLIVVSDLEVTNANPDDPEDYQEFEVNGCLRVDDLIWRGETWLDRTVGATYTSITGILNFSFENSKIEPRYEDDVE